MYASDPIKKVIGAFEIGGILHEEPQSLWDKTKTHAGISKDRFFEYFRDKPKGYAIEVKATQIYNTPLTLNRLLIASPPQSFMYLWYVMN